MLCVSLLNFLQIILNLSKFLLILPQICFKFYLVYFCIFKFEFKICKIAQITTTSRSRCKPNSSNTLFSASSMR